MKTTGAVWLEYLASWPDEQWIEDSDESVGGISIDDLGRKLVAGDIIDFSCGQVFSNQSADDGKSLVRHFVAWKKASASDVFTCRIPKDGVPAFKTFLKSIGASAV